jgi:hypothetical protein
MSEVKLMQSMLESVITKIIEIEESIEECKKDKSNTAKLAELKRSLATQLRVKITLIKSIEELTPSTSVMTIFTSPSSILSKIKNFFWPSVDSDKIKSITN